MEKMKLSTELARIFETSMQRIIDRENAELEFLNQKDFPDCRSRAAEGVRLAIEDGVIDTLALAIAVSREKKQGDDTTEEQASLVSEPTTDIEVGTQAWWNDSTL